LYADAIAYGIAAGDTLADLFNGARELMTERHWYRLFRDGMRCCWADGWATEELVEVTGGLLASFRRGMYRFYNYELCDWVSFTVLHLSSNHHVHTLPHMPHHAGLILICPLPHSGSGTCSKRKSSRPWKRTALIIFPADMLGIDFD
jgi:hypothetical protein